MTGFRERARAFENRFIHEQEIEFQINGLRNRIFGLWVAENIGLDGLLADLYVEEMTVNRLNAASDQILLQKATTDLKLKGIVMTIDEVEAKLAECQRRAQKEFMKDSL